MNKVQTIEDFYKEKLSWVPADLKKGIGHFNVFRFEDFAGKTAVMTPFSRKDYYKISLLTGRRKLYYADKTIKTGKQALLFSNPQAPYKWEPVADEPGGCCCIFTPEFFHQFGNWKSYPVFRLDATPVFELTKKQAEHIRQIYDQMLEEMNSDYAYKYDVLKNLVFGIVHFALKLQPASDADHHERNAARRISLQFMELLERQFPVDNPGHLVRLRSAADYSLLLSVHVNHLNKALKETTGKTTSEIIAERVLRESKILLKGTDWSVSEIAYALGFKEVTHFNNFFKKHTDTSPTTFRN